MQRGAFGGRLAHAFSLANPPTLISRTVGSCLLAVTELRYDETNYGFSTPIAPEEAYLIGLQLRSARHYELWLNGQSVAIGPFEKGKTCFFDLTCNPIVYCSDPFHSVHFYVPFRALSEAGNELGLEVRALRYRSGEFIDDPVIRHLANCLIPSLHAGNHVNQTFVDHMLLAMRSHLVRTYGGARQVKPAPQYGLAPWQEKRVKELIAEHLCDGISLAELADNCGLSLSYLARGFKRNTGATPHQWFMTKRLELAIKLMRDPDLSLADVALSTGFADQCHFTRMFSAKIGVSPGAWRAGRAGHARWAKGQKSSVSREPAINDFAPQVSEVS
ncbi:MAG TPA: AraC family transcriptional regulator [Dyella sp.]|uniref:helix-turn-helix domain-containing protein n=1 Tax=Dyella sp. TaxID=1869338 RepID=UPI002D790762|nr:AraC family transcriptional regulator [Dyella sp.]HET6552794.1 AraC family transcriptional regulator [Dyella sp.]